MLRLLPGAARRPLLSVGVQIMLDSAEMEQLLGQLVDRIVTIENYLIEKGASPAEFR